MGMPSSGFARAAAVGKQFVRRVRLRQRVGRIVTDEGVDFAVHARNLVEACLRGLARGNFALGELRGKFRNGELVQHI